MDHIIGGYFLVEGRAHPPWATLPHLPDRFWSISGCIAALHPHIHLLAWTHKTPEEVATLKGTMHLSDATLADATTAATDAFDAGHLGWPSVWLDPTHAQAFYASHLRHLDHLKLLGIALPEVYADQALQEYTPASAQMGETGVYTMLRRGQRLSAGASLRGYEILGSEIGGDFHSFACNGLEAAYTDTLAITLNAHGLIAAYDDAVQAASYTNRDSTGAEPGLWLPWLVFEASLVGG
ncbi:MAG: hypothetical protein WCI67_01005 [Chloroflexales bacterium]